MAVPNCCSNGLRWLAQLVQYRRHDAILLTNQGAEQMLRFELRVTALFG